MQSLSLALKNLRGIRTGLGLEVPTLDFERPADGSELVAIAAANGSGETTVMDNMNPSCCFRHANMGRLSPGGWSIPDGQHPPPWRGR